MKRHRADAFAQEWISAWNAHDLEAILAHYDEEIVLHSPMIQRVTGADQASLKGRIALEAYWKRALELAPDLRFDLEGVMLGRDAITILYNNQSGRRASETFVFGQNMRVTLSIATYAEP